MVTEDGKKMRLVKEETILYFQSVSLGPPLTAYSVESMREMGLHQVDIAIMLRAFQASREIRDMQADVLQQYDARGYAYRLDMEEQIRLAELELAELVNSP
jgi:hypothetical protein